jgi:hypothetical protein
MPTLDCDGACCSAVVARSKDLSLQTLKNEKAGRAAPAFESCGGWVRLAVSESAAVVILLTVVLAVSAALIVVVVTVVIPVNVLVLILVIAARVGLL